MHSFLPDRWEQIVPLLDGALDRPPEARRAFLDEAGTGDPELRRRVDELLAECERSDSLFGASAVERFPGLLHHSEPQLPAVVAARYRIDKPIGAGGMATVYLARDLRYDRNVALKVLNPELGAMIGPERFLAEIRVTATLQHPNVLPLFDSGEVNGALFYVMPFVAGETLRQRLGRERQLPVDEAVRIACAIAGALDYAHRQGVIHRDLKPENILLNDGQPFVMDFGIALALSNAGGARITQSGISLGTPQYMSPEQATGDRQIDARSDVYSLGAVVYEMLSGDPPHTGSTVQAVVAKLLTDQPRSLRTARPVIPAHVDATVLRALAKLPADRFVSASQFAEALSGARAFAASVSRDSSAQPAGRGALSRGPVALLGRRVAPWLVSALAVAAAVIPRLKAAPADPVPLHVEISLPVGLSELAAGPSVVLSRDGTQLLVAANRGGRSLYVRRLDEPVMREVPGTSGALAARFSPDGRWLLFLRGTTLYKIPVAGGTAQPLFTDVGGGGGSAWGEGDLILFHSAQSLWLGTADGRSRRLLSGPDTTRGILNYAHPQILPGGQHALVTFQRGLAVPDSARLGVVSLKDGRLIDLNMVGSYARYASPGFIVFGRPDGIIFAAPFSLNRLAVTGRPVRILDGVYAGNRGRFAIDVADNGVIAYRRQAPRSLVVVDRQGRERPLSAEPRFFHAPRVAPDGRRVAVQIGPNQLDGDVWVLDLESHATTPITAGGVSYRPEWTGDGRRILFLRRQNFDSEFVLSKPWDVTGDSTVIARGEYLKLHEVSPGPNGVAAIRRGEGETMDILLGSLDSLAAAKPIVATTAGEFSPRLSPDGRLLAYASDASGRNEIYIQSLPSGRRIPVSVDGGSEPAWSRDGGTLYYRTASHMIAATIARNPALAVSRREVLFADAYWRYEPHTAYDVFPNGDFVMVRQGDLESRVFVIINWPALLKRSGNRVVEGAR